MYAIDLSGLSVLITGAAGGIGRGIADTVRQCGGTTIGWDVKPAPGVDVVDVTDRAAVAAALDRLAADGRVPDGLVNCAGVSSRIPFLELDEAEWWRVVDINLTATFRVSQLWARHRVGFGKGGAIVNLSSITARVASPQGVHYAATKGGVDALTRGMAVALGPHGIRVNALGPGPIATDMTRARWSTEAGRQELLERVLVGRLGTPDDLAGLAAWLLSPLASWTTGTTFFLDGGILATR